MSRRQGQTKINFSTKWKLLMFNLIIWRIEQKIWSQHKKCIKWSINKLLQAKKFLQTCAKSTDSDHYAHAQSDLGRWSPLIYLISSNDFVSGQPRPWSECADVQADLSLHCPYAWRHVFAWNSQTSSIIFWSQLRSFTTLIIHCKFQPLHFNTYLENDFSTFSYGVQIWLYPKKVKGQPMIIIWTNFPDAIYQDSALKLSWFWRRRSLNVFTIYGHGSHLVQMALNHLNKLSIPFRQKASCERSG